jgi:hypothetical protein
VTYERLKAFCEANNISMSQYVESRVGETLPAGNAPRPGDRSLGITPTPARPMPRAPEPPATLNRPVPPAPRPERTEPVKPAPPTSALAPVVPMTSVAARFVVEPPPPIIKPKQEQAAPKPAEKRPDQIFTF